MADSLNHQAAEVVTVDVTVEDFIDAFKTTWRLSETDGHMEQVGIWDHAYEEEYVGEAMNHLYVSAKHHFLVKLLLSLPTGDVRDHPGAQNYPGAQTSRTLSQGI